MEREEMLNLIPAYALGALDEDDRLRVEGLLANDTEAQQLLADYQTIQSALIFSAPLRNAPAHLTDDLQRRLAAEKPGHKTRRFSLIRYGWAAAVLLVAAFVGVLLLLNRPSSPETIYNALVNDVESRLVEVVPVLTNSLDGELIIAKNDNQAVIRVNNLPAITNNQAFQLWMVDENGARSGGIFQFEQPQLTNYIVIPLEKPASEYDRFGVSLEPVTGSPLADGPSGPQILSIPLN